MKELIDLRVWINLQRKMDLCVMRNENLNLKKNQMNNNLKQYTKL